jgi:hypothetical protein
VGLFDVEESGRDTGYWPSAMLSKVGGDAVDEGALNLVGVLIQEAETEDTQGIGLASSFWTMRLSFSPAST